jgi:hypothetical protein
MVIFLIIIITWPMIRIDRPDDNAAIRGAIMKDSGSVHKNVQEMCDCYATTDPLKEMSTIKDEPDARSAALKWAALAALHGVGSNAEQITLSRSDDGRITVFAEYRPAELPSPGKDAGREIFETFRQMTHIDADKGKTLLALGIRDSSIDLEVKVKKKNGREKIKIGFPKR